MQKCKVCGAGLVAENMDLERNVVRCDYCHSVFDLGETPRRVPRARVPMPEKFQVEEEPGLLRISWRWFSGAMIALAFFCVIWDGFLFFWYRSALSAKHVPWMAVAFPLLHVCVGVGLTYRMLAGFVNTTVVEVSRRSLRILHGPLPWFGNRHFEGRELTQLYVKRVVATDEDRRTFTTYDVNALLKNGRSVKLLRGFGQAEQALYLEEQLEARLGIQDEPVEGELPRDERRAG